MRASSRRSSALALAELGPKLGAVRNDPALASLLEDPAVRASRPERQHALAAERPARSLAALARDAIGSSLRGGAMLKLTFCLHRLPGLSRAEFQRYWRETHAPLVRRHAAALGIERYVQVHAGYDDFSAALRAGRGGPEGYDGVAELWWKDRARLRGGAGDAGGAARGSRAARGRAALHRPGALAPLARRREAGDRVERGLEERLAVRRVGRDLAGERDHLDARRLPAGVVAGLSGICGFGMAWVLAPAQRRSTSQTVRTRRTRRPKALRWMLRRSSTSRRRSSV